MTRSLGCSMARAMASPLRVKNTAYFDIAATPSTNGHLDSCRPARWRLCAQDSTDKRAEPGAGCQDPVPRYSMAPGDEPGSPSGSPACTGGGGKANRTWSRCKKGRPSIHYGVGTRHALEG